MKGRAFATAALGLFLLVRCSPFGGDDGDGSNPEDEGDAGGHDSGTSAALDAAAPTDANPTTSSSGSADDGGASSSSGVPIGDQDAALSSSSSSGTLGCNVQPTEPSQATVADCTGLPNGPYPGSSQEEVGGEVPIAIARNHAACGSFDAPADVEVFSVTGIAKGDCISFYFRGAGSMQLSIGAQGLVSTANPTSVSFTAQDATTATIRLTGSTGAWELAVY